MLRRWNSAPSAKDQRARTRLTSPPTGSWEHSSQARSPLARFCAPREHFRDLGIVAAVASTILLALRALSRPRRSRGPSRARFCSPYENFRDLDTVAADARTILLALRELSRPRHSRGPSRARFCSPYENFRDPDAVAARRQHDSARLTRTFTTPTQSRPVARTILLALRELSRPRHSRRPSLARFFSPREHFHDRRARPASDHRTRHRKRGDCHTARQQRVR
jgi:hypothetical protein